jgi:hypothetical protein
MSCICDYSLGKKPCSGFTCLETAAAAIMTQKIISNQVRVPASMYMMNRSAFTSAANRLASKSNINWNQMSDRVLPAQQVKIVPTRGNSLHSTLTSGNPGASSPGGAGVDVKHDSYARYLNRKKTTQIIKAPLNSVITGSGQCCL